MKFYKMDKLSIIILLLCISGFHFTSTKITPLRKTLHYPNRDLIFEYKYQTEGKLAYAVCDRSDRTDEKNCTVIREKFPFQESPLSCNITLKVKQDNVELTEKFTVVPFGDDNAVVAWAERNYLRSHIKLMTIKMSNCKISNETSMFAEGAHSHGSNAVFFVTYTNYYDVFFVDNSKCVDKSCKVTFDANGNIVNGPIAAVPSRYGWLKSKKCWKPISVDSVNEGTFFVAHNLLEERGVYNHTVLHPNGSETIVGVFKDAFEPAIAAATNGIITVCYQTNIEGKTFNCTQNEIYGNTKYLSLKLDEKWIKISDIYSLPNDEFLTLILKGIGPKTMSYTLMKVNSDGQRQKTFEVPYLNFIEKLPDEQIFKNKNDYCILVVTYNSVHHYGIDDFVDLYVDCFTYADFS